MVLLTLDYTVIAFKILNIIGIVLGVLGLVYASYSIIKKYVAVDLLAKFLQVGTPIIFTTTLYGGIGGVLERFVFHDPRVTPNVVFAEALLFGAAGALIGAYNGIFIDPFQAKRVIFDPRHFVIGAVLTFTLIFAGWAGLDIALATDATVAAVDPWLAAQAGLGVALRDAIILAPFGAILAGFWRFINNPRLYRHREVAPLPAQSIRLSSRSGMILGFLTALPFGLGITVIGNLNFLNVVNNPHLIDDLRLVLLNSLGACAIFAAIGALNGSFARQFFQWVNSLSDDHVGLDRIGLVGFVITLVGFLFQLMQTLQDLVSTFRG